MKQKMIVLASLLMLFLLGSVSLSMSSNDTVADEKKGYIGASTCKGCHEAQYESYAKSIHSKKQVRGPEYKEACETCHGAGAKHVEKGGGRGVDIFDFGKKVDAKARGAKCLTCHEETKHLSSWDMSKHKIAGLACNDCHSVHATGKHNLKKEQPELCYGCHKDIRAQGNKQSHHPIKEGKMSCSACHNPHGEFGSKMIKADTVNELCYTCHAEKRGPFMNEHPPVEENCLSCHTPHGSNHGKLLVKKTPQLCQSCHEQRFHPATPYEQSNTFYGTASNKLIARSCLNCHTNVHGGNGAGKRGLRFMR